jgi:hypothetical protein
MRPIVLSALLFAALSCAARALAQEPEQQADTAPHVVVMSIGGDAPEAIAREVREAVGAALQRDAMRVMSEGDLELAINPSRLAECRAIACAHAIGRELGVATVAAVTTWMNGDTPRSIAVSLIVAATRAHTAREDLGERTIADTAAAAVRGAQDARARALLVEGSLDPETAVQQAEERAAPPPPPPSGERSLESYVLPAIMGAVGLGLGALAVYALIDENCAVRADSGLCLRGDRPNIGLGAVTAIVGGLLIAGAIVWLIVGGDAPPAQTIDVVVGPEGGGVSWRGTF